MSETESTASDLISTYMTSIQRIERAIVQALDIAADLLDELADQGLPTTSTSSDDPQARAEGMMRAYMTLLDKIQYGLKSVVHEMCKNRMLLVNEDGKTVTVPHRTALYGNRLDQLLRHNQ